MWPFTGLERAIRRLSFRLVRPCGFFCRLTKRTDMLYYAVSAAPPVDKDVVSRTLTVTVNGELVETRTLTADATDLGEVGVKEGDLVVLVLTDTDDADNVSAPSEISFTAADTLPPGAPDFGVTLVREE